MESKHLKISIGVEPSLMLAIDQAAKLRKMNRADYCRTVLKVAVGLQEFTQLKFEFENATNVRTESKSHGSTTTQTPPR